MTRDEIVTMAREAGMILPSGKYFLEHQDAVMRFAALVAAKERKKHQADIERWKGEAAKAEKWRGLAMSKDPNPRIVQEVQAEARAEEREACASGSACSRARQALPRGCDGNDPKRISTEGDGMNVKKKQPPALTGPDLEEFRAAVAEAARAPLLERIAEMECQLSAIVAGGVESLRKRECLHAVQEPARGQSGFEAWWRDKYPAFAMRAPDVWEAAMHHAAQGDAQ